MEKFSYIKLKKKISDFAIIIFNFTKISRNHHIFTILFSQVILKNLVFCTEMVIWVEFWWLMMKKKYDRL
jgi:hypothetical protein